MAPWSNNALVQRFSMIIATLHKH